MVPLNAIEIGKEISDNIESKFIILDKKREVVRIILNHICIDIANQVSSTIKGDLRSRVLFYKFNCLFYLIKSVCLIH